MSADCGRDDSSALARFSAMIGDCRQVDRLGDASGLGRLNSSNCHGVDVQMTADEIVALIAARMPEADPIRVEGDDGVHFSALVVSPAFNGLRPVQRHQRVYAALEGLVGGAIHALALETLTPEEWAARLPTR